MTRREALQWAAQMRRSIAHYRRCMARSASAGEGYPEHRAYLERNLRSCIEGLRTAQRMLAYQRRRKLQLTY